MRYPQVAGGDVVTSENGGLLVDDLVDAQVGVEVGLDVLEDGNRAVGTSTTMKRLAFSF